MRNLFLFLLICYELFYFAICNVTSTDLSVPENTTIAGIRKAKWFGIGFVRFENAWCIGRDGLEGTCYTRRQCREIEGGVASGRCISSSIGTCCVIQKTCGDVSAYNNTYFVNPSFPAPDIGGVICTIIIPKCNEDICQLRIDFLSLSLAQPDGNGLCELDAMTIQGGSTVPTICGENSGQHVYVDFIMSQDIRILITTSGLSSFQRNWKLKVAQIACDSPTRAPSGCLQWYTDISGVVSSFNYGRTLSANNIDQGPNVPAIAGTRQMANTNYGICVEMRPGYCSITWAPVAGDLLSFTVTGDTVGDAAAGDVGTEAVGVMGINCITDFVVIPNACTPDLLPTNVDRYCGNYLPTLTTGSKPFVMTVVTDEDEITVETDVGNRGFSLMYTQNRCSTQATQNRVCIF